MNFGFRNYDRLLVEKRDIRVENLLFLNIDVNVDNG